MNTIDTATTEPQKFNYIFRLPAHDIDEICVTATSPEEAVEKLATWVEYKGDLPDGDISVDDVNCADPDIEGSRAYCRYDVEDVKPSAIKQTNPQVLPEIDPLIGRKVIVYADPITRKNIEGVATIVGNDDCPINLEHGLLFYNVVFDDEGDGEAFGRTFTNQDILGDTFICGWCGETRSTSEIQPNGECKPCVDAGVEAK